MNAEIRSTIVRGSLCLLLAGGATLSAAPQAAPLDEPEGPSLAPPGTEPVTEPRRADPALVHALIAQDGRPMIAGRDIGLVPRQHPDWTRPAARIPAALAEAEHPEHYIYEGRAISMPVDGRQLAVHLRPGWVDATGTARAAGVAAAASWDAGIAGWELVDLDQPVASPQAVAKHLEALSRQPEVEFVAPVFMNPEIPGGWLSVTRDILVRIQPDFLPIADAVLAHAAPDLLVVEREFAGLPGAYRLRSEAPDGFAVLRAANRLALDPRFAWSEPEMIGTLELHVIPNDPRFPDSWALHNIGQNGCCTDMDLDAPEAWDVANGDWEMRVLVMDVGIQQDHPDLNLVVGSDFTDGTASGSGDGSPVGVCDRHGTAVAGCISGRINNGIGTAGIAPDSRVVSARIGSQATNPCSVTFASFSSAWVANALNWAYGQGIEITNASFGVSSSSAITDAYDDTWFNGMLHFASAGNSSSSSISFPSSLGTVHSVAAIDPDGTLTSFSNSGTGLAFAAPGISIWTTDQTGSAGYSSGDFTVAQGTSFAAPFAAGCAALVWSALPDYSSTAIEFWLQDTATDRGATGYDTNYGWGIPNPRAALNGPGPFNNFCANAWPIFSPSFHPAPFDTSQATAFSDEPQAWCEWNNAGESNSVWFAFFAPCDAVVDIDTTGSDYDTIISLWAGLCTFAFPIECNDDEEGSFVYTSRLTDIPVAGDTLYMIKVSDYNESSRGGMLDFDFTFRQPNDECSDAISIGAGSVEFCTLGATNSANQVTCGDVNTTMVGDVWFEHTATQTGNLTIRTCGDESYDTQLLVYEEANGLSCPFGPYGARLVACDDDSTDACTSVSSQVTVAVQAGMRYAIRVAGHDGPAGDGELTLAYETCAEDVDGDNDVGINDLLRVLAAWGTNDADADITGDGVVDIDDLLQVLAAWGTCP